MLIERPARFTETRVYISTTLQTHTFVLTNFYMYTTYSFLKTLHRSTSGSGTCWLLADIRNPNSVNYRIWVTQ